MTSDFNFGGGDLNPQGNNFNSQAGQTDSAFANWLIGTGLVKTRKSADSVMLVFAISGIIFSIFLTIKVL